VIVLPGWRDLSDAQLLELVLQEPSISRAVSILQACDGIHGLLRLSPFELSSELGLSALEGARISERWEQEPGELAHLDEKAGGE
jgi:hypothetical protein